MYTACVPSQKDTETEPAEALIREETEPVTSVFDVQMLIERNLRLVAHIMKKYYAQADDQEDLISIGTIGLIKGISTFDPSKGARLATYAARCIENEILTQMRLWFQTSFPRAEKNGNGVFWYRFPRMFIFFVRLRTAM